MRHCICIGLFLLLNIPSEIKAQAPKIENFKWLEGRWKNLKTGHFEVWKFNEENGTMEGYGLKYNKKDSSITERLYIKCEEESCHYIADVSQNKEPVKFKIVKWSLTSFRSENPEHSFPKFIQYELSSLKYMKAEIGTEKRKMSFDFEKQQ